MVCILVSTVNLQVSSFEIELTQKKINSIKIP